MLKKDGARSSGEGRLRQFVGGFLAGKARGNSSALTKEATANTFSYNASEDVRHEIAEIRYR